MFVSYRLAAGSTTEALHNMVPNELLKGSSHKLTMLQDRGALLTYCTSTALSETQINYGVRPDGSNATGVLGRRMLLADL